MSGRWFRLYEELVDDPKVQRLPGDTFKALVNLWCLASRNDGVLPSDEDIAFSLRMAPAKVQRLLADLRLVGLVEDGGEGVTRPHNWTGRQFKSDVSNERVKQHRQRQRNVTPAVTAALHATPPDSETEQIQSRTEADSDSEREAFKLGDPKTEINGAIAPTVAALVKRAAKKATIPPDRCWLKPTDTRVERAKREWFAEYGSELPLQYRGKSEGYLVPWRFVQ